LFSGNTPGAIDAAVVFDYFVLLRLRKRVGHTGGVNHWHRLRSIAMNSIFVPALTLQAPERIHAEGDLRSWQEAARIPCPCDAPPPENPHFKNEA
jgi:hypothetical protein